MFKSSNHKELRESLSSIGASIAIFEVESNSYKLVTANTLFEELLDIPIQQAIGSQCSQLFDRYIHLPTIKAFKACIEQQCPVETEIAIDKATTTRWWRFIITPILTPEKEYNERLLVTAIEITDKKLLEQQLARSNQRYEAVVESAYDGIITIDDQHNITQINSVAKDMFFIEADDILGQPLNKLIPLRFQKHHDHHIDGFRQSSVNSRPMQSRLPVAGLRTDNTEFPLEVTISKINVVGNVEMTATLRDISERARLIEELSKAAVEDHLTSLTNRRGLEREFEKELHRNKRFNTPICLVVLDVDHFKQINDDYGHITGDKILQNLAKLLKANSRYVDTMARWGGEEFAALLVETDITGAIAWSEKMRKEIEQHPHQIDGNDIYITASFGIACLDEKHNSLEQLFALADSRLYQAKANGRNKVQSD